MPFLYTVALVLFLALIVVLITQVVIPIIQGRTIFPMLRKTTISLEGEIAELKQQLSEKDLEKIRNTLKDKLLKSSPVDESTKH